VCRYRETVDGNICHRCIYLGSHEIARRAESLIEQWREELVTPEERHLRDLQRQCGLFASARGYSGRAKVRLRKAVESTANDPVAQLKLVVSLRDDDCQIRSGKKPGRPRRSGLW